MTILKLLFSLLIPFITGYSCLKIIFQKKQLPLTASLALAYGLGLGILSQWMLLLGVLGTTYSSKTIGLPLVFLTFIFLFLTFRKEKNTLAENNSRQHLSKNYSSTLGQNSFLQKISYHLLFLYILYYVVFVFWRALNIPIYAWDAIATISLKAKIFFYSESLFDLPRLPHSSYPLQIPFIQTWIAFNLGEWNDQLVKIIFPFIFVAYIVMLNYFLKNFTNKIWAMLGTALVVSSNFFVAFATVSFRDFFLSYYNCGAIMLLILWNKKQDRAFLLLASLFSGFTTFTKLEGIGYLLIHIAIVISILVQQRTKSIKDKFKKLIFFSIPCLSIYCFYSFYKLAAKVPGSGRFQLEITWENLKRAPTIIKMFGDNLLLSGNWNIIWFLLILNLLTYFLSRKNRQESQSTGINMVSTSGTHLSGPAWRRDREALAETEGPPLRFLILNKNHNAIKLLSIALTLFFLLYFFLALLTPNFISIAGKEAIDVLPRIILHFFPLSTLLIVLLNYSMRKDDIHIR